MTTVRTLAPRMARVRSLLPRVAATVAGATVLLSAVAGCGSTSDNNEDSTVRVVTSTNVYADIAAHVGGPAVEVSSFINSPDQDPHAYEPTTRDALAVSEADVVVENGGGYDDFLDTLLDSSDTDARVLNAVDISGRTAPAGGELNEHVWYDLPSMQLVAAQIAEALGEVDPDGAQTYTDNAAAFSAEVEKQVARTARLERLLGGTAVAVTEPVPGYLLAALGVEDLTPAEFSQAIEEGEDVSVSVLEETLSLFSDHSVSALVYNEQTTGPTTEQVTGAAADAGVPVVPVTELLPDGQTYVSWMAANIGALDAALSKGAESTQGAESKQGIQQGVEPTQGVDQP